MLPPFEEEDQNLTQYTPFEESQENKDGGTTVLSHHQPTSEVPRSEDIIDEVILDREGQSKIDSAIYLRNGTTTEMTDPHHGEASKMSGIKTSKIQVRHGSQLQETN